MRSFLIWLLLSLAALAQTVTFPDQPFQALQLKVAITGAQLNVPRDSRGSDLSERYYTGTWTPNLKLEGSAQAGDLAGVGACTVQVNLFVEGQKVASFEKRLYENRSVGFEVKLPPATKAQGQAEFFIHVFRQGEDGVRIRGKLDNQAAPLNPLDQLLKLYLARIPKGIVSDGKLNNVRSLADPACLPYTCGGYQKQVLLFLDRLRFSKNPAERALVANLEYGPIESSGGYHQGVVIYESGKDWTTGLVLDPWPNQRPEWVTVARWSQTFRLVQPSTSYTGAAATYPILGGAYQDPDIGAGRLTAEERTVLKSLPPSHQAYQAKLSDYARRVWLRGAVQRFRTSGKAFVKCPVEARLVDGSGAYTGLKNDQLAVQIGGTEVFLYHQPGDNWFQFGFPEGTPLQLELQPLATGQASVTLYTAARPNGQTYSVDLRPGQLQKVPLTAGTTPALPEETLFNNNNGYGTLDGAAEPRLSFETPVVVTAIQTYHWNSGRGATPGRIALTNTETGQVYGPWQATGSPGQGGVPNAFWTCALKQELPAGTYRVLDSEPATWSSNPQSGGQGFAIVRGYRKATAVPSVREVEAIRLVGNHRITDTGRTYQQYHAEARLLPDGRGWVREFLNNRPGPARYPKTLDPQGFAPILWSYDRRTGAFSFDWTMGGKLAGLGRFDGQVQGTLHRFSLSGHWSNGRAATIVLERSQP